MRRALGLGVLLVAAGLALGGCAALFDIDEKRFTEPDVPLATDLPPAGEPAPAPPTPASAPIPRLATPPRSPPHGARPPPRPSGSSSGVASAIAFGAGAMYMGAIDPDTGDRDPNAWRRIGFDVDGVDTTAARATSVSGAGTCRSPAGAPFDSLVDGFGGRDNNFGSQVLKATAAFSSGPESLEVGASMGMAEGSPTFVIVISDLGEGPDDPEVALGIVMTKQVATRPSETGSYRFPVDARTVLPGSVVPRMLFKRAYMTNHTVVSGDFNAPAEAPFLMPLDPSSDITVLTPLATTVAIELDPTHQRALSATVSLVLPMTDVVSLLSPVALRFGVIPCGAAGRAALFNMTQRFADLRSDRPNFLDPTGESECDAITYAFRLRLFRVRVPVLADVSLPTPSTPSCPIP